MTVRKPPPYLLLTTIFFPLRIYRVCSDCQQVLSAPISRNRVSPLSLCCVPFSVLSGQFHILNLTLFSKFYFNFPSQYLFAIGFTVIFSVRCQLPPIVSFIQQSQAVLLLSLQSIHQTAGTRS